MARTFPVYTPTVLKLTDEQLAKVPHGLQVKYGINRVKQKNGAVYVTERAYYIDPKTHQSHAIASVKIGTIPPGEQEVVYDRKEPKVRKNRVVESFANKAQMALADPRQQGKVRFALDLFWTVCLLCALTGRTDAESIADYWNSHRKSLFKGFETGAECDISADTVLRLMSLLTVEESTALANTFIKSCAVSQNCDNTMPTIVAIDGQSVRASRIDGKRCGHILNLYNCSEHSFMGQCLIENKKSEVSSTEELLKPYDLQGTLVTADALFAKQNMFEVIVNKQADYCIPVKDNARLVSRAIDAAFTAALTADDDDVQQAKIRHLALETELDHGRIEERVADVLPASLLPKKMRDRWVGLEDGCIVQYLTRCTNKKTGETTTQIKRAVSSIRWDNEHADVILATALRQHWSIENNLHWTLDVAFRQDRIQCKNGQYLYARAWLNKAALNLLQRYKETTGTDKSIERLMVEMHNWATGLKCLQVSLD